MTERNYYVICDDNCRFEGMTKEQIYDAIAEATGATPTPVDSAFITKIVEQNAESNMKFWFGTEAEHNALSEIDPDTIYIIGSNEIRSIDALAQALPVEKGGTGASNAADARTNLGITNLFYIDEVETHEYNYTANEYKSFSESYPIRSGYTPIIIQATCIRSDYVRVVDYNFTPDNYIHLFTRNGSSSAVSNCKFKCILLQIKDELL